MIVSKKDKDFILLIFSAIFLLWFLFSLSSYLFSILSLKNSKKINLLISNNAENGWINTSRKINRRDLEGRLIILDFCNKISINCSENISNVRKIKNHFGNQILLLKIFQDHDSHDDIMNFAKTYNIKSPIIIDKNSEIKKSFDISQATSENGLAIISPNGKFAGFWPNIDKKSLSAEINNIINDNSLVFSSRSFPLSVKYEDKSILGSPSKVEYAKNFQYKNRKISALIIANFAKNNITISSLGGKIIKKLGKDNVAGFKNGSLLEAEFNHPLGVLYSKDILYVADTLNHSIRKVDFKKGRVTTIIGSGIKGDVITKKTKAKDIKLSYPSDLDYFPDKNHIIIANSGTNQLLKYDIKNNIISVFAGNGEFGQKDGPAPSLSRPIALDSFRSKLYFIDQDSSSLRVADKSGYVRTLVSDNINVAYKNNNKKQILMKKPSGLFINDSGAYIADSKNHLIRKYNFKSKKISYYSGNKEKSDKIGKVTSYNNISDIILIKNKFYIADKGNNRIVVKDKASGKTEILDIIPRLILEQDAVAEYLPDIGIIQENNVISNKEIKLNLKLKSGYKINNSAPSIINLVEINNKNEATLIASYDWNIIRSNNIKLPTLSEDLTYYLHGRIYYCKDKKNSICLVNNYQSKILANGLNTKKIINIIF